MKFKVTLSTIADITIDVDAEDEESAIDAAYDVARGVTGQIGHNWTVGYNQEWQYAEPVAKEVR